MTCMGRKADWGSWIKNVYTIRNLPSEEIFKSIGFYIAARLLSLSATLYFASQHAMSGNDVGA